MFYNKLPSIFLHLLFRAQENFKVEVRPAKAATFKLVLGENAIEKLI